MRGGRIPVATFERIHRPESSASLVVVPRPVVVNAQRRIELFAREEIVIRRRTRAAQEVPEGVVIIGIGYRACGTGEEAHAAVTVKTARRRSGAVT